MTEVKSSFSALPAFNTIFHYRYKAFNWVIRAVLLRSIGLTIISFVVLFIFQNTITVDLVFIAILSAFLAIFTLPSVLLISQHLSQSDIREMQINFKSKEERRDARLQENSHIVPRRNSTKMYFNGRSDRMGISARS